MLQRFTERAKKVIELAITEAIGLNHHYVGTEDLLLGLLRANDGLSGHVLINQGIKVEAVREAICSLERDRN